MVIKLTKRNEEGVVIRTTYLNKTPDYLSIKKVQQKDFVYYLIDWGDKQLTEKYKYTFATLEEAEDLISKIIFSQRTLFDVDKELNNL